MKELKLKYSSWLPFDGYYAITLFGCLVRRNKYKNTPVSKDTYNHESIHVAQAYDFGIGFCGYFIFYILYVLEWLIKMFISVFTLFKVQAYRSISFEQEAYDNQIYLDYIQNRKRFSWLKYIFTVVK